MSYAFIYLYSYVYFSIEGREPVLPGSLILVLANKRVRKPALTCYWLACFISHCWRCWCCGKQARKAK